MSLRERAMAFDAMNRDSRLLTVAGIRARHPDASDEELKLRLFVRTYGRELAERVYGTIPDDAK